MEENTKAPSQEEIDKADLMNKSAIMKDIKKALSESKGEPITGITFHYNDRTITYFPYTDRAERVKTHVPLIDELIDNILPILDTEATIHETNANKITVPNP